MRDDQGSWDRKWELEQGRENQCENWNCEQQAGLVVLKQAFDVFGYPECR